MRRLILSSLSLLLLAVSGCADKPEPTTIIGEWSAVAIHLPEGIRGADGNERMAMEDYGEGQLMIARDSTFRSKLRIKKDMRVTKRMGAADITTTLINRGTSSERTGSYRDSMGYLILDQPDLTHAAKFQLLNGVLVTTSIIQGSPIQIIWHHHD
jgi:hypothetical protein